MNICINTTSNSETTEFTATITFECGLKKCVKYSFETSDARPCLSTALAQLKYWHESRHSLEYKNYKETHPNSNGVPYTPSCGDVDVSNMIGTIFK